MRTTLAFPDDLLQEVKHEAIRQHRRLNDLVPELVRLGLAAQRQAPPPAVREAEAEAWLTEWRALGTRIAAKTTEGDTLVEGLEADRGSRG